MLPQSSAQLVLLESGQVFHLQGSRLKVGRGDPQLGVFPDVVINDEMRTVGRIHAYLICEEGQWFIENCASSPQKTRLNGQSLFPYEHYQLQNGDLLRFGRIEARFELHF